ncbi:receptor, partial [Branchiostoma belcheri]
VTVQATCLTLAAVSVDRYCVIVHPVASLIFRRKRVAVAGSVIIWIEKSKMSGSRRTYRTLPLDVPHSPAERIALSRRTSRTLPREVPHSVLHSPAELSFLMALPDLMHYRLVELNWEPYGWQTICRPVWPSKSYERGYMIYSVLSTYFIPFLICLISGVPIVYRLWHRFDNVTVPPNNVEKVKHSSGHAMALSHSVLEDLAQFWTHKGLVPFRLSTVLDTQGPCPVPCLGLSTVLDTQGPCPVTCLGLSTVLDTQGPCPVPCFGLSTVLDTQGPCPVTCLGLSTVLDTQGPCPVTCLGLSTVLDTQGPCTVTCLGLSTVLDTQGPCTVTCLGLSTVLDTQGPCPVPCFGLSTVLDTQGPCPVPCFGLSTVLDTQGPCPVPCFGHMIDSTSVLCAQAQNRTGTVRGIMT